MISQSPNRRVESKISQVAVYAAQAAYTDARMMLQTTTLVQLHGRDGARLFCPVADLSPDQRPSEGSEADFGERDWQAGKHTHSVSWVHRTICKDTKNVFEHDADVYESNGSVGAYYNDLGRSDRGTRLVALLLSAPLQHF